MGIRKRQHLPLQLGKNIICAGNLNVRTDDKAKVTSTRTVWCGYIVEVQLRAREIGSQERRRRCRSVEIADEEHFAYSTCENKCNDRIRVGGYRPLYKEERDILISEQR